MTTNNNRLTALSADEHSAQLRRAVVASTVGTTIEWYDFLLYGTMACTRLRQAVLSEVVANHRYSEIVRRVFRRIRWAADRGGHLRPLGGSDRAQGDADHHSVGHRNCDGSPSDWY